MLPRLFSFRDKHSSKHSVRIRLLTLALLPMLVIMPVLLGLGIFYWNNRHDAMLITKVNGDLTIAHQYFSQRLKSADAQVDALGKSAAFRDVLNSQNPQQLETFLKKSQGQNLDFLYLINPDGTLFTANDQHQSPLNPAHWPVIQKALQGQSSSVVDVFNQNILQAISPALAEQAQLPLVITPNAKPSKNHEENRGMVVQSASPVTLPNGNIAALVGGQLLNRNLAFIDTINELVYQRASLPEGSRGTATLFLEDVRISTNVRLFENQRALGTRVSEAVREIVLDEGRTWLNRAFVVNDWYISAYEPIHDSFENRVGMLYVGFLEAPFRHAKYTSLGIILLGFIIAAVITVPMLLRWASGIFLPLETMNATISRVESGNFSARTGLAKADDEITRVACHLDDLLDQLQLRNKELQQAADSLNDRVDERTLELREANQQLELTTQQLIVSEKLAAIGGITAGVAHEINNPVAVMQGNIDLLAELLGEKVDLVKPEVILINEQLQRINLIVTRLLQFARPEEYAGYVDQVSPTEVFENSLPLVQHLLKKSAITITREHQSTRQVSMNRTELQQVLVNLIVNAIHAMPNGGTLLLRDKDCQYESNNGLLIEVSDSGSGINNDIIEHIFDPFFTTKKQAGTGLGLSISQTLIHRHGGRISVKSCPEKGTHFQILLPQAH